MRRRVAVTGLGLVTPLGGEVEDFWGRLVAGTPGVAAPRLHAEDRPPTRAVGEVPDDLVRRLSARHRAVAALADRRTLYGYAAALGAVEDAGLSSGPHPRAGVVLAAGPGSHRLEDLDPWLDESGRFDAPRFAREVDRVHPESEVRSASERPATLVARDLGMRGPVSCVTTACSAASHALGAAFRAVRSGRADWVVAGGSDTRIDPVGLVWFVLVGASARVDGDPAAACRPFDLGRTGLVMGEGAGCVVLEAEEHARARGAHVYAELAGYASTLDAWRATACHPEGRGIAEAMRRAMRDAGVEPEEVGYVCAHGTGTKRNDPAEARAICDVFGDHARKVPVSSTKSMMGHLLVAAASVSFAAAALAVERDLVPPTINLDRPDPTCDLDLVRGTARRTPVRVALVNSLAFGGQNACLVLKKWEASR